MDEYPQTPVTPDGGQENSFPVDLSREEYIAFTLLLAKQGGALRFRRGQLAIFACAAGGQPSDAGCGILPSPGRSIW